MMKTDVVYGYGVNAHELSKIKNETLINFFKKHLPDDHAKMIKAINTGEAYDADDWFDYYECYNTCRCGKYAVIANAIAKDTGISFEYHCSEESNEMAILFVEQMPWNYSETERNLTKNDLDVIFKKYFDELEVEVCLDFCSVEYFG